VSQESERSGELRESRACSSALQVLAVDSFPVGIQALWLGQLIGHAPNPPEVHDRICPGVLAPALVEPKSISPVVVH
jgi:hypothetical protein